MLLIIFAAATLFIIIFFFLRQPQFGKLPQGKRLEKIKASPHYCNGAFQNLSDTPALTEGASYAGVLWEFFFRKNQGAAPAGELPSIKTDLRSLDPNQHVLIWFGHSSYFLQVDGKTVLVDPVLNGSASPIKFTTRSFKGTDRYEADDMPMIDYLFITHDHYDHLDYRTILQLKPKIRKLITGLGVGAHLERWGVDPAIIEERDWNEAITLDPGFVVHTAPARHFSGRAFKRNSSLWMSFVLITPSRRIYLGGDSGYDDHFRSIGDKFGPFDLAILENGQYNRHWKHIHMMPEETVQAAADLHARMFLPVHWGKFSLALHSWKEPAERVVREAAARNIQVLHPLIGEAVDLDSSVAGKQWWIAEA